MFKTIEDQNDVLESVKTNYDDIKSGRKFVEFLREEHVSYLLKSLSSLPFNYSALDASQPWFCFWALHSLQILSIDVPEELYSDIIMFLKQCQSPDGGFGGGPGKTPHMVTTYAAICALCILGKNYPDAYNAVDRYALKKFLIASKNIDGSFNTAEDSESDLRAIYCAVISAKLMKISTDELFENTADYIQKCQTYEGGLSAVPGTEAHAGYTYCGYVALCLLNSEDKIDKNLLLKWMAHRQMSYEGGFQGRTNKLVDSCYSFWVGALFPIVIGAECLDSEDHNTNYVMNRHDLQMYVLGNCQCALGGFIDKPGKFKDLYHTCYSLSGLSLSQIHPDFERDSVIITNKDTDALNPISPYYNLCNSVLTKAVCHFRFIDYI